MVLMWADVSFASIREDKESVDSPESWLSWVAMATTGFCCIERGVINEAGDEGAELDRAGEEGADIFSASFVYCSLAMAHVFVNCLLSCASEIEISASCSSSSLDLLLHPSSSWYSELISCID